MNRETLSVHREESLPVPFNHIDVVRHTQHTFGHIARTKKRRSLESRWCATTIWILDRIHERARERLTTIHTTSRSDDILPEVWSTMSKKITTGSKTSMWYRETQAGRCTPIDIDVLHGFGWSRIWHRHQESKKKIAIACGIRHAMWSTKKLREKKKTLQNSMSTSRWEPCAETQLAETSYTKEEEDNSNTINAHKIDAYESPSFRMNEKRQTKARRAYCRPWIHFCESLQIASYADTHS